MRLFVIFFGMLALVGCQTLPNRETNMPSVEDASSAWLRTELYFAIGLQDGSPNFEVGDHVMALEGWRQFVDEVVTPLFPDGLTVFDATGQWLSSRFESPPKLESRVLVILHPATEEANLRIEQVRTEFLKLTGQQSVLRVTQAAQVSF